MMKRFEHGGDVYTHEGVLDFSANLNPMGIPAAVREALRSSIDQFDVYPDPTCRKLRALIASHEGVPESRIVVSAGATDAMARACHVLKPQVALVCAPCYSGYEQALSHEGARVVYYELSRDAGFALDDGIIDALTPEIDLAFFASPNNPTGLTIPPDLLERIIRRANASGTTVILDECFVDFTESTSAVGLLDAYQNLIVVKAFTKSYALAGLRLGYLLCPSDEFAQRAIDAGPMWAGSTPAQIAGCAAYEDEEYLPKSREYVARERKRIIDTMRALGLRVVPSEANYVLFESPKPLFEPMLSRGVLIRRCENYIGLDSSWFRVAVRTEQENLKMLAVLEEVLS